MDGVLYHGEKLIPEALTFLSTIEHIPHAFITNNPSLHVDAIADRLERLGFQRPQDHQIVTSAEATAQFLSQQKADFRFFAVGGEGIHRALHEAGGKEDREAADFVVIGEGAGINYEVITTGLNLIIKKNARLICTNPDHNVDAYVKGQHRVLPGGGALVAPFAVAAEVEPVFIGKPHPLLYQMAMQRLNVVAEECLMIGDRPDTDILGAARLGMKTALVRTGRFAPGRPIPTGLPQPNWDVTSLTDLLRIF